MKTLIMRRRMVVAKLATSLVGIVFNICLVDIANAANAGDKAMVSGAAQKNRDLQLLATVGYVYSLAGDWHKSSAGQESNNRSVATGGVGYGASLLYKPSWGGGFGLSVDYTGFNHDWVGGGGNNGVTDYNYSARYDIFTITPSYRIALDSRNHWGLRLGVGVGFSLSDVAWGRSPSPANNAAARVVGGASYHLKDYDGAVLGIATACVLTDSQGAGVGRQAANSWFGCNSNHPTDSSDAAIVDYLKNNTGNIVVIDDDGLNGVDDPDAEYPVAYNVWTKAMQTKSSALKLASVDDFEHGYRVVSIPYTIWNRLSTETQEAIQKLGALPTNIVGDSGSAKDDMGFVIAPQVALEYDNGAFHADINLRYFHALKDVEYYGK
ncbi:MAG: hypothetical protein QM529_07660, partial [Hydrotalea sp.]|nr:hypothetical protein [Hydrotalea sp.]